MASQYVAKHPYNGNRSENQLSFPVGAVILVPPGQEGNVWWWGNYNGQDGWFPPAFVGPMPPVPPPLAAVPRMTNPLPNTNFQQQQDVSMQQRMQQVSFTSSTAKQQQPLLQQQQSYQTRDVSSDFAGLRVNPNPVMPLSPTGFQTGMDDPFAGLDSQPLTLPSPATSFVGGVNLTASNQQNMTNPSNPIVTRGDIKSTSSSSFSPSDATKNTQVLQQTIDRAGSTVTQSSVNSEIRFTETVPASTSAPSVSRSLEAVSISAIQQPVAASVLRQDTQQKKMIEERVAQMKAEEDERRIREKEQLDRKTELEWERKVNEEREARLKAAKADSMAIANATTSSTIPFLHPKAPKHYWNPYEHLTEGSREPERTFDPIYRVQPYWSLLDLNTYIKKVFAKPEKQTITEKYDRLTKAMSFLCHIVQENERLNASSSGMDAPLSYLKSNQLGLEACIKLIGLLPYSAGASGKELDALFLTFIHAFVSFLGNIQPHQQIVLPGGWQNAPGEGHVCLYILRNCGEYKYSFTVCNTGPDGLQYHPSTFDQSTGLKRKQLAMTIWDIPQPRISDSSFWVVLFRMLVYPHKKHGAELLYTSLLPSLNSRPLWSNLDEGPAEYMDLPDADDVITFQPLSLLALTTIPVAGARPSKYSSFLVMSAAVDIAYQSLTSMGPGSMDPEDSRILKLSGRNLANSAASLDPGTVSDGSLLSTLTYTWNLLDRLLQKLNITSSKPTDQYSHGLSSESLSDNFSKGSITTFQTDSGSASHPLFGRFRRDDYENVVKALMGEPRPDPILIPANLTDEFMPPVATDFQTAASSLQRVCDACSLLLHQRQQLKNAPAFVASAAQYALTVTLPLPDLDPRQCFWRKSTMRHETQVNLLFLIRRLCRIYSAASACIQQSRGLTAIKTTALACAACISDAIVRIAAVDDPSPFSLHYNGTCEGPVEPFGIEAGSFETLAASLPIFDPIYVALRFRCLDYLRGRSKKNDGSNQRTVFNFDQSMSPLPDDVELMNQLSIQLALTRPFPATEKANISHACSLISGANGCLLEVLPELEYFRDIIFYFKHSVSGKAPTPTDASDDSIWMPHHAYLKWSVTQPSNSDDSVPAFRVTSFGNTPQEFVQTSTEIKKSAFESFVSFFSKSATERRKLSAADPTNIVNSCGEKFLKTK